MTKFKPLFSSAASSYKDSNKLQREVFSILFDPLPELEKGCILDTGCGTGDLTSQLQSLFPSHPIQGSDISETMIAEAKQHYPTIPFTCSPSDVAIATDVALLACSSTLQWIDDLEPTLNSFKAQCIPGAQLYFSIFGPASFTELHQALNVTFKNPPKLASQKFKTFEDTHTAITTHLCKDPSCETVTISQVFPTVTDLIRSVKALGALEAYSGGLWTPRHIKRMEDYFFSTFGEIRISYELFMFRMKLSTQPESELS